MVTNPAVYRQKALRSLGSLPPFSPILNRLTATLAAEDVSFGKVADLIEKDTVLAGNILRMVNSALYGRRGTISSVRHAVSLMGLMKLRNAVMTLSVAQLWTATKTNMPGGWPAKRFNVHGVAAGVMADLLVQRVSIEFPEGAFVVGLLHDIGLLVLAISLPEEFSEARQMHVESGMPLEEAERAVLGMDHAELSAAALHQWNLPGPIQRAVRYQFEVEQRKGEELPLSWLVRAADALVQAQGVSIFDSPGPSPTLEEALREAQIEADVERLVADYEREFAPMRAFF